MSPQIPRDVTSSAETRIGAVLRQLREQQGLSLRTLGNRIGFSASFLSQVENGQVSPSIASLERIAGELGVTLADLFEASQFPVPIVVRADSRPGFTSSWSRARVEALTSPGERRSLEAVLVTMERSGESGKYAAGHAAEQFAYVLKGPLALFLRDEEMQLQTGDAAVIPRKTPHRWRNASNGSTQVLLISPRFSR